jgi:ParB-like chromosome segregation protein Spo0J
MNGGTTTGEPVMIALDRISDSDRFQSRVNGLNNAHVERLVEAGVETLPPPVVTPNGRGGFDPVTGNHTLAANRKQGRSELLCIVDPSAGYPEAFASNLRHGLPHEKADQKEYARWLSVTEPGLSLREIGRRCGLSDKTVKRAIEGANAESPHPCSAPDPLDRWFSQTNRLDRPPSTRDVKRDINSYDESERPPRRQALCSARQGTSRSRDTVSGKAVMPTVFHC